MPARASLLTERYVRDHGEMLGDHGLLTKSVFYEPSAVVPLIVRPPDGTPGRTVRGLVEHVDVPATIRAIAGAGPVPESEGRSLLGHARPGGDGFTREAAFSQVYGFVLAATERYKLIVHEESRAPVQLFDLAVDPREDDNLVDDPTYAAVRDELTGRYMAPFLERSPAPA
jgi:arylsulfatase A-like enzyme